MTPSHMTLGPVAVVALLLVGATADCGGDSSSGAGGTATNGSGAGPTSTSAASGGAGGAGGSLPLCPGAEPTEGASCTDEGLECSYGDEVIADCRKRWSCSAGKWTDVTPVPGKKCSGSGCPPNGPPTSGGVCDEAFLDEACGYRDGTACTCMNCIDQGGGPCMMVDPPQWICPPLPTDPGCPPIAPNEGTACDTNMLECLYYGACGLDVTCVGGAWTWAPGPCPE